MPTPQQQLPDPLQRSISPGGFDSFSLAADFPSLTMLSPHSQQAQQAQHAQHAQQAQGPPSLSRQQLPSYDLSGAPRRPSRLVSAQYEVTHYKGIDCARWVC